MSLFAKMTHADNQSSCTNKHINNLETNRHIRVVHVIANTLFSHTTPIYYMLVHARNNLIVLQKTHFHHRYCLVLAIDQSAQALPDCAQTFYALKENLLKTNFYFIPITSSVSNSSNSRIAMIDSPILPTLTNTPNMMLLCPFSTNSLEYHPITNPHGWHS